MKVALSQISPVWLNKQATLQKIITEIEKAGSQKSSLVIFGEALLPGYPFWLAFTGGATFDNPLQKEMFAIYQKNAVDIEAGELKDIQDCCQKNKIATYLGTIEKSKERSGFTLYCSLVYINQEGKIQSSHR